MKERQSRQKQSLRFSVPPYYVGMVDGELPVLNVPGEMWNDLGAAYAPSAGESRQTLVQLRSELRWPRSALAAFLGVSREVVRRWETGERNPSGAARRLIWLLNLLVRSPERLRNGVDLIFWGRGDELAKLSRSLGKVT